MARPDTRQAQIPLESEEGVVRAEKAIPAMDRPVAMPTPPGPTPSQCTGRCGHCHLDPCQLHAPI